MATLRLCRFGSMVAAKQLLSSRKVIPAASMKERGSLFMEPVQAHAKVQTLLAAPSHSERSLPLSSTGSSTSLCKHEDVRDAQYWASLSSSWHAIVPPVHEGGGVMREGWMNVNGAELWAADSAIGY